MTEFEIASLAAREAALWVAVAQIAATVAIGTGQIAIVWYGIRAMNRSSAERAQDRRERERASERRHAETMAAIDTQRRALETLITRTGTAAD